MTARDPLLVALIEKLPTQGKFFSAADRQAWLELMCKAFDLVYGRGDCDQEQFRPSVMDQEPAGEPVELPAVKLRGAPKAAVVALDTDESSVAA